MSTLFLAFIAISLLLAVTPGPDMALVTKNALAHGTRGVLLTTTGIAIALVLWVTASAVGVAAVLKASSTLFSALKIVGGAYLAYLGVRAWLASREKPVDLLAGLKAAPAGSILRQGLISAGTNPKLGVFFVTFLPQFVDPHQQPLPQLLVLGFVFGLIGWAWMNVYGLLIAKIRDFITAPRVRQWMDRITGTVLIGLGVRLAFDRA
ncbi:MAG: LysE family translocator [Candidatus Dormibacteraeota bacterium]|nr:LysE family translocator [Candidatus Dormibacteraeota bacterium]